jgi:riboflavin biosynthesis pyrimidine reductase
MPAACLRASGEEPTVTASPDPAPTSPEPLDVLLEDARERGGVRGEMRGGSALDRIALSYGGPLEIPLRADRPTIVANFVESLDGVVALGTGPRGGGSDISGASQADRFVMGLLRSVADAVVVGAGTMRSAPRHEWTPRAIAPGWAADFAAWRASLGLAAQPTTVVVTSVGDIPDGHPALMRDDVPVVIATTARGADRVASLADRLSGSGTTRRVRVEALADSGSVTPEALVGLLMRLGIRLAVCEGGPHLLAGLLEAGRVDELFLTVAPQVLGRGPGVAARLGFAEGHAWEPGDAAWGELRSVRRSGSHLFLRYAFRPR